MPPKRTRAAAGSSKAISASQPEPQRPATRPPGRKRRHSDASNISDAPSIGSEIANAVLKTPAKRRKKAKVTAEVESKVIIEEQDEEMVESEPTAPACAGASEQLQAVSDEIQVSQSSTKQVHFETTGAEDYFEKSTATNITPHPRKKMTVKRRTLSPNMGGGSKRIKTSRTSLPPTLSRGSVDPSQIVEEYQFAPLRTVLNERIRQRAALKGETEQDEQDEEDMDEDMLVLENAEEVTYPQLLTPASTPSDGERTSKVESDEESETSRRRSGWAEERKTFHDMILALEREANKATADLKILAIELEALGFAEEGASSLAILQSIRDSFYHAQDFLTTELPGTVPEDATNQEILEILIANVKEFATRLRTADKELMEKGTLTADLGKQVHGLLDHLAEKEMRVKQLEEQWTEMDTSIEGKDREIEGLEDDLQAAENERDAELERANGLEDDKSGLEKSLERLRTSLEDYQSESTRLTELVTRMEDEHRDTVNAMNREREETVRDLEDRLDVQTEQHTTAQRQADDYSERVTDLEDDIQNLETHRDTLLDQLEATKAERDNEAEEKDAALADLEEKNAEVQHLETRVDRLEEQLEEMKGELDNLRAENQTAQSQREAAEQELDDRNQEVDDLQAKLRDDGKEANTLRMKIYELQTQMGESDSRIKALEQEMSDRDEQFQEDMAAEVERREDADGLAQERAATILDLHARLEEVELRMKNLLAEKDERIAEKDARISELEDEVAQRDADMQDLEVTHERETEQKRLRLEDLEGSIATLKDTITTHEEQIQDLQQEAQDAENTHTADTEEHDNIVLNLNQQIANLESDKASLERRVEHQAEQMLQIQNTLAEEADALKATILDKQDKIRAVQAKAEQADQSWQDVLDARDTEIEALKATHEDAVKNLNGREEEVKRKFRAYVRRSTDTIEHLQQQLENAKAAVDEEGEALKDEGENVLRELGESDGLNGAPAMGASKQQVEKVGVKTRGRKRLMDSAIGLEGESLLEA